jgi:3-dehydroquinate synthase
MSNETVHVALAGRSYDIHIGGGMLSRAGELLKPFARGLVPIVTDEHVAKLHLQKLTASLDASGIKSKSIVLSPGEGTKSFAGLEKLTAELLAFGVDRGGLIVALGGGVIGDLVGFAAGVLKRGVDFAQIPTTLLAQVDSSVGGKTAINMPEGKNLVGMFHQPRIVISDIDTLSTLPKRELLAGYAEVLKYGALGDADFFTWLEVNGGKALAGDMAARTHIVARSCKMKADIVACDERETRDRALLNLGHTFGHALEAATGFSDRLLHGEGVAIGTVLALQLSTKLGFSSDGDAARFARHLKSVGLPASIADIAGPRPDPDTLISHMMHDKKVHDGKLTFVLVKGIGQAFTSRDVPIDAVRAVLDVV